MSAYQVDPARQTGRTTRAVARALVAAAQGNHVVYVVHHRAMTGYVEALARHLCGEMGVPKTFAVVSREQRSYGVGRLDLAIYDHFQGGR